MHPINANATTPIRQRRTMAVSLPRLPAKRSDEGDDSRHG